MFKRSNVKFILDFWKVVVTALFCFLFTYQSLAGSKLDTNPELGDIKPVLIRIMNWAVFVVGIVFVFYILYGAAKASTALGDPRGLESAKSTWTYALYGVIIVAAFFGIFSLVTRFFGLNFGLAEIFDSIIASINAFFQAGVETPASN